MHLILLGKLSFSLIYRAIYINFIKRAFSIKPIIKLGKFWYDNNGIRDLFICCFNKICILLHLNYNNISMEGFCYKLPSKY